MGKDKNSAGEAGKDFGEFMKKETKEAAQKTWEEVKKELLQVWEKGKEEAQREWRRQLIPIPQDGSAGPVV
jgi:gas vesicle protein